MSDSSEGGTITLTDRERWGGEVVGTRRLTYCWGTHRYVGHLQYHADGDGHIQVKAPSQPPPAAEAIVDDGLDRGGEAALIAAALADGWGVDVDSRLNYARG